ncbi:hypothetical protein D3C81_645350 [compost metagenome]
MGVINRRLLGFQRFWPGYGHHIADPAAVLVLQRSSLLTIIVVGDAGCADMWWDVALIFVQLSAQALAVDQPIVEIAVKRLANVFTHKILIRLAFENTLVKQLLELLRQRGPVGAYRFQPFVHHLFAAVRFGDQPGVTFFTALFGTANGGHQET